MTIAIQKDHANQLLRKVIQDVSDLGYTFKKPIQSELFFFRAIKTYGKCVEKRNHIEIGISIHLLQCDENEILNTLYHEVCHAVKGTKGHQESWKKVAHHVGAVYHQKITRTGDLKLINPNISTQNPKYFLICNQCLFEIPRFRKGKAISHPEKFKHISCGGIFSSYDAERKLIAGKDVLKAK